MNPSNPDRCRLDHLVICARDLAQGVEWFGDLSGVQLPIGGQHPLMATHNHLTALSDDSFLEVIAIDPDAPAPAFSAGQQRWFSLDNGAHQAQLEIAPRLTTWVVATRNLDAALAALRKLGLNPGEPVEQTRGDMRWRLSLQNDGSLACDGVFPILIEWPEGVNPVSRMQDQNVRLEALHLSHPDFERIEAGLRILGIAELATIEEGTASIRADFSVGNQSFSVNS
ncbi:VOC family protein [Granulosicoccus antarcticus]|uniref:Glyoxalase-like domain-containing protein n=1 Tax=Granulosicoccus antarcticus IMCC3135 TaxID=1192854 RepID=A0A2Z2NZ88_9GAMM|nr:VOC family protein [Granulosicoccus antarcticus]ASJ75251.1 hypothetical protein IMCC3135_25980 [Granulosicoccus antarcticus IMCC3135]